MEESGFLLWGPAVSCILLHSGGYDLHGPALSNPGNNRFSEEENVFT